MKLKAQLKFYEIKDNKKGVSVISCIFTAHKELDTKLKSDRQIGLHLFRDETLEKNIEADLLYEITCTSLQNLGKREGYLTALWWANTPSIELLELTDKSIIKAIEKKLESGYYDEQTS